MDHRSASFVVSISLVAFLVACGGSGVDVKGKTNQEAAEEIASVVCEELASCELLDIDCVSDESDMGFTCTVVEVDEPVSELACRAETEEDILDDLECIGMLTDTQAEVVNECINKALDQACRSRQELEEIADQLNNGLEPEIENIPECDALEELFDKCE